MIQYSGAVIIPFHLSNLFGAVNLDKILTKTVAFIGKYGTIFTYMLMRICEYCVMVGGFDGFQI